MATLCLALGAYLPTEYVVNFNVNDRECDMAMDPMLGASANPDRVHVGSIWGRLGDRLLATGRWDRVLIAPVSGRD